MLDTKKLFSDAWASEIKDRQKREPAFKPEEYTATGRASAEYGGRQGVDWWQDNGPVMVDNYCRWRDKTRWEIWHPEPNLPAVELGIDFDLPGGIPVKTFIDRIFVLPTGELAICDIKTGSRIPTYPEQLGLYRVAAMARFGEPINWGYYWDARKGTHGNPIDLTMWTPEVFAQMYEQAIRGIEAGAFLPNPQNGCQSWCGVSAHCFAVGGEKAAEADPLAKGVA